MFLKIQEKNAALLQILEEEHKMTAVQQQADMHPTFCSVAVKGLR